MSDPTPQPTTTPAPPQFGEGMAVAGRLFNAPFLGHVRTADNNLTFVTGDTQTEAVGKAVALLSKRGGAAHVTSRAGGPTVPVAKLTAPRAGDAGDYTVTVALLGQEAFVIEPTPVTPPPPPAPVHRNPTWLGPAVLALLCLAVGLLITGVVTGEVGFTVASCFTVLSVPVLLVLTQRPRGPQ